MAAALSETAGDDGIGVGVLAAVGPVFSAGQDLREMTRRRSREEAAAGGLVTRLCPTDRLLDEALAVAAGIAAAPSQAVVATKRLILAARADALEATMSRELGELAGLVRAGLERR